MYYNIEQVSKSVMPQGENKCFCMPLQYSVDGDNLDGCRTWEAVSLDRVVGVLLSVLGAWGGPGWQHVGCIAMERRMIKQKVRNAY